MKIQFKIYNIDIIDCSSCYNLIYPNPASREILLEMILRVCESDVISRIGQFKFWLDDIELQSPIVYGAGGYKHKSENSRYNLQVGTKAELNKLSGLYVELKEDALERIIEPSWEGRHGLFICNRVFYIEPGLNGIRKAIMYIRSLYSNQRNNLPDYLKELNLKHFGFSSGIIWRMNKDWGKSKDGIFESIDYERDRIGASSTESGIEFGFGNFGGDSPDIYTSERYLTHLNKITEVLDGIAPGKYMAGPDEMEELLKVDVLKKEGS